jgi:hypothetical protein
MIGSRIRLRALPELITSKSLNGDNYDRTISTRPSRKLRKASRS